MEDARLTDNTNTILLVDFNTKARLWSPNRRNARGTYYIALNNGFIRRNSKSYTDITLAFE